MHIHVLIKSSWQLAISRDTFVISFVCANVAATMVYWVFLTFTVCLVILFLTFYNLAFNYWKKRNVPILYKPTIPFGTIPNPLFTTLVHLGVFLKSLYFEARAQQFKHAGGFAFFVPMYLAVDPEYIKNILEADWNYFPDRGVYQNEKYDALSANLFSLGGEKWRFLRSKLSPAFTPGKLKTVCEDMLKCSVQMLDEIKKLSENKQEFNIMDVTDRFTVDVIGSCVFGIQCNSFKNPEAIFQKQARKAMHFSVLRVALNAFSCSFPNISRYLGIRVFSKEANFFFLNLVENMMQYRKTNKCVKEDFLQLLFNLEEQIDDGDRKITEITKGFSIEELTAQVFAFFVAGYDTSSLTLTYCLYELSLNQELQNKLREEINQVLIKHDGKVNYHSIMDMKYLTQVVKETLRKYPPVPYLTRLCEKDYQIPGSETVIEKGTLTMISVLGLHYDPEYYPEPDKFDPERFSEENESNRIPFTHIPFGKGPRMCIGLRFGILQTGIGLISLIRCFRFSFNKRTKVPIEATPLSFTIVPKSAILLNAEVI